MFSEAAVIVAIETAKDLILQSSIHKCNSYLVTIMESSDELQAYPDASRDAIAMLSGPAQKSVKAANKAFASALSAWTFKETGVLKVNAVTHYLNEGAQKGLEINPRGYRVKNDVHYGISLSSWSVDHWEPFILPAGDNLQLEVTMLSPFHRLNLAPVQSREGLRGCLGFDSTSTYGTRPCTKYGDCGRKASRGFCCEHCTSGRQVAPLRKC